MPYSSGTFTRTDGTRTGANVWAQAEAADVDINSADFDTHDEDMAQGLSMAILKDGSQTVIADIPMNSHKFTGLSAGSSNGDSVRFEQVTQGANIPSGSIIMTAAAAAPTGWLLCDGSAISRTTYSELFTAISTAYGTGDGSTTFNLPDLRQRFPLGKAASGTGNALGATGGEIDHDHSVPAHYHAMGTGADLNITSSGSGTSGNGGAHQHFVANGDLVSAALSTTNTTGRSYDAGNDFSYELRGGPNGADRGLTSAAANHTHTTPSHTHAAGNIAGRIGLVTAGVDGNAAMTSGTQNPPFVVLNYIIKT